MNVFLPRLLLITSWLATTSPKFNRKRGARRRVTQNKAPGTVDRMIISTHHSAAAGDIAADSFLDLNLKPPNLTLIQSPPKNYRSMIYWTEGTYETSLSLPTMGLLGQNNITFQLSSSAHLTSLVNQFDQFCIYSASVRWFVDSSLNQSNFASLGRICTAIDWDNASTLSSFQAFEDYNNSKVDTIVAGKSWERFIKPAVTPAVYNGSSAFSGFAVGRTWLDSASSGIPHFGLRTAVIGNPSTTQAYTLLGVVTLVCGFRNSI